MDNFRRQVQVTNLFNQTYPQLHNILHGTVTTTLVEFKDFVHVTSVKRPPLVEDDVKGDILMNVEKNPM